MTGSRFRRGFLLAWLVATAPAFAQDLSSKNPRAGDPEAIRFGMGSFRGRCANCHGMDARGGRGPDLLPVLAVATDERLFQTIKRGVPGTEMPASGASTSEDEIWATLAYLRNLAVPGLAETPRGDAASGEQIFAANCAGCHRVRGSGGRLGPDLSRIGSGRTHAALTREIRTASAYLVPGYEPVTLVTADGSRVRGVIKNEDTFSIQIMDVGERLRGYLKSELRDVVKDKRSVMPDFGHDRLNDSQLNDLLSYLGSLRGSPSRRQEE
jgi:putative heme-binding domain-containing protein